MSLFNTSLPPLAERMRPVKLEEYVGQGHITSEDGIVGRMIAGKKPVSLILWGGPGCGKTTLARIIADTLELESFYMSAVSAGVADVRKVIDAGMKNREMGIDTLLFLDEIHRFNKAQQDSVLQAVENGSIILIGATTENPSFSIIAPLLSRTHLVTLKPLEPASLIDILDRALTTDSHLSMYSLTDTAKKLLAESCGGDARKMLNLLEALAATETGAEIDYEAVMRIIKNTPAYYDRAGERHYDTISAFIKSVRGSDPDAAIYYLARMLNGGEDPLFIARRLVILASEDIGNASPQALTIAVSAMNACAQIGMPEARIILAQAVTFLASSPKSNASYSAIDKAISDTKNDSAPIPLYLRNAPTEMLKDIGYSEGYVYPHDQVGSFSGQDYFPEGKEKVYYKPTDNGTEKAIDERLKKLWPKRRE
jgi:putative ATPase